MTIHTEARSPDPADLEGFIRTFVDRYVDENRSVMITSAFDVAYGGCGPFAEELAFALQEAFPAISAHDRDTSDMLSSDAGLPQPEGFEYALHVYVEVDTPSGSLFYDAVTPQGVPYPSMLSFNAEQIRFARAYGDRDDPN